MAQKNSTSTLSTAFCGTSDIVIVQTAAITGHCIRTFNSEGRHVNTNLYLDRYAGTIMIRAIALRAVRRTLCTMMYVKHIHVAVHITDRFS